MNIMSPIRRLARRINRMRLAMAESDLAFLEARAPVTIAEQRAAVQRLRAKVEITELVASADAIARRAERKIKRIGVLS
jgi:hypothetical protein